MADINLLEAPCDYEHCPGALDEDVTKDDSGVFHESCFETMHAAERDYWAKHFQAEFLADDLIRAIDAA